MTTNQLGYAIPYLLITHRFSGLFRLVFIASNNDKKLVEGEINRPSSEVFSGSTTGHHEANFQREDNS